MLSDKKARDWSTLWDSYFLQVSNSAEKTSDFANTVMTCFLILSNGKCIFIMRENFFPTFE